MAEETRIVLRNVGKIDPLNIKEYLKAGGYKSLKKARDMSQLSVIEEVKKSGLRGRGGASFNTGIKWTAAFSTPADQKYVVCNADEGEPGTYKDRIILENDPQSVIEGMAICGYAIGADKGYIYCRAEYPYVVKILNQAIAQAKDKGVLGDFDLEVRMGAGAYVCGEETALIESLEGKRGEPRYKPPYPPNVGLWQKPTIVNNVETFANIPFILGKGGQLFAGIGAKGYPGTKIVTLTGDVVNTTFFEVPTNTTIRQVIYDFGGGVKNGKQLKAVQVGGSSGAFIPEDLLDTPIDCDSMYAAGATLGSGAVFVLDETRDIADVVERISKFFAHESCGKCIPCREGTMRTHEILKKINQKEGDEKDLTVLENLGGHMSTACFCGLGQASPTPVLSTLKYFRNDYQAKLRP